MILSVREHRLILGWDAFAGCRCRLNLFCQANWILWPLDPQQIKADCIMAATPLTLWRAVPSSAVPLLPLRLRCCSCVYDAAAVCDMLQLRVCDSAAACVWCCSCVCDAAAACVMLQLRVWCFMQLRVWCCSCVYDAADECMMLQLSVWCCSYVCDAAATCVMLQLRVWCCSCLYNAASACVMLQLYARFSSAA